MSKYNYNKDYFSKINSAEKAYWLGFLYADGCINRFYTGEKLRSMTLEIGLCAEDKHHLEKFLLCLDSNVPIKDKINKFQGKEYKSARIQINNTKLCYDLCALGCTPQKTYNISFPSDEIVPYKYKRDFIRGYFDGDGCISVRTNKNHNKSIIVTLTGMSTMLQSIVDFLIAEKVLWVRPKFYDDKRSKATSVFFYGIDHNKELLDYLYDNATIYLDRKYNMYTSFYNSYSLSQFRGVYYDKSSQKYKATISIQGKRKVLGSFKNIEDAINARKQAEIEKINNMPA